MMNKLRTYGLSSLLVAGLMMTACNKDDSLPVVPPAVENEMEVITDVKLIFTNAANSSDVVEARAEDTDGLGVAEMTVIDTINLDTNKTYTLTFEIMNNLETPGENIGTEIAEEKENHQVFYSFSDNAFSAPAGNGNIDTASDPLNYSDEDANGNPVGLKTSWTTPSTVLSGGSFTVKMMHQAGVKTATSTAADGDADFELTFVLNIK